MSAGKKSLLTCGQFSSVAPGVGKLEAHSQRGLDGRLWVRASPGAVVGVGGAFHQTWLRDLHDPGACPQAQASHLCLRPAT